MPDRFRNDLQKAAYKNCVGFMIRGKMIDFLDRETLKVGKLDVIDNEVEDARDLFYSYSV